MQDLELYTASVSKARWCFEFSFSLGVDLLEKEDTHNTCVTCEGELGGN